MSYQEYCYKEKFTDASYATYYKHVRQRPHCLWPGFKSQALRRDFMYNMKWDNHIKIVASKAHERIFVLRNLRKATEGLFPLIRAYKQLIL